MGKTDSKYRKCCICESDKTYMTGLTPIWRSHKCGKDSCTGYLCDNCHTKFGNSKDNIIKYMRQFRTGTLSPFSDQGKGFIGARIVAKTLGVEHLSKRLKYGYVEVKTATFATGREQGYDTMILVCMNENWNNVERIYAVKRKSITIYENWYKEFRIDEKLYNDTFHNMKIENCSVLKKGNKN